MSVYSSKQFLSIKRLVAAIAIVTMITMALPVNYAWAQEAPDTQSTDTTGGQSGSGDGSANDGGAGTDGAAATSSDPSPDGTDGATGTTTPNNDGSDGSDGTTQDNTASSSDTTATTSPDGTDSNPGGDGTDGSLNDGAGTDGADGAATSTNPCGETPDCTATSTATSTDPNAGDSGTSGPDGNDGSDGSGGNAEEADPLDPVPVFSENDLGDGLSNDPNEVTGGVDSHRSRSATVVTGDATAQGKLYSDVNSGDIKSLFDPATFTDLDIYTFAATGTNEADVDNTAAILADTGNNSADSFGQSTVSTGAAYAAVNIANVVNTNVVNSDGFLYLKNQILNPNQSLDLSDFFFPDPDSVLAAASTCNLSSCAAEDIQYNFAQTNTANVQNNAAVQALSGDNYANGEFADIYTGDAYGGANVINIVNTNVVDSNYRFLTFNAMGDLDGDLVLPNQNLFTAFYSRPNGMTQVEQAEDITVNALAVNNGYVNDNLDTYAESGLNTASTLAPGDITTGNADAESNIFDKINQTIYGGDSMYLLIRVHGSWTGDIKGLPAGLAYTWTSDGVLIYNPNGEIAPSPILPYDVDKYTANLQSFNTANIDNNISIRAISGRNLIEGSSGSIATGDAIASANVMNLANTNIIGTNFAYAIINIFGDFDGDVTFTETDLTLTGDVSAPSPLGPSDALSYTYTVHNNSTSPATNVVLRQALQNATVDGTNTQQSQSLGTINPGESKQVSFAAIVDSSIPVGTTSVKAVATVESDAGDINFSDNVLLHSLIAEHLSGAGNTDGTTTPDNTASTTDQGDTGTTTGETGDTDTTVETEEPPVVTETTNTSRSGGGGGGGKKKDKVEEIDPASAPLLVLQKTSNVDDDEVVVAGQPVDYVIEITNRGGNAYDAVLYDTLTNPIGSVLNEDSWELGTILAGEVIEVEYTTTYSLQTPSGEYTNTASIEAYRHEDSKAAGDDPLKLDTVEHIIEVEGRPLAVGNVQPLAFFPTPTGDVGALIVWETSKPSQSQVFYSPKTLISPFNQYLPNYGYQFASFKFPELRTKHAMIIYGLKQGTTYTYRIHADNGEHTAFGGDYTMVIPAYVAQLTLANQPTSQVAGAATSSPTAPAPTYTPPIGGAVAAPKPQPEPEPVSEPEPAPEPEPEPEKPGIVGGVVNKVFGFFR